MLNLPNAKLCPNQKSAFYPQSAPISPPTIEQNMPTVELEKEGKDTKRKGLQQTRNQMASQNALAPMIPQVTWPQGLKWLPNSTGLALSAHQILVPSPLNCWKYISGGCAARDICARSLRSGRVYSPGSTIMD